MKNKLPFLKKKEHEEEEIDAQSEEKTGLTEITDLNSVDEDALDEEDAKEDKSIINKLKAKLAALQKKKKKTSDDDEEEEDEDSEEDDEEEKKKKKSKIIRIAIVAALVVFLASDYIFPPEDNPTPEATPEVVESPAKRNKKKVEETPPAETVESTGTEEPPVETPIPDTANDLPDVSADTSNDTSTDILSDDSSSSTTTYTPDDSPVDITTDDSVDSIPDHSSNDSIFGEDSSTGDVGSPDFGTSTSSDDFTDQILQDLEKQAKPVEEKKAVTKYVSPPDYEYVGRGLVYNCVGKHWACVDAPSYKVCEDNASSTKFLGKSTECYPFNVYETTRGCEITQNRMISSNAKTKFCNE